VIAGVALHQAIHLHHEEVLADPQWVNTPEFQTYINSPWASLKGYSEYTMGFKFPNNTDGIARIDRLLIDETKQKVVIIDWKSGNYSQKWDTDLQTDVYLYAVSAAYPNYTIELSYVFLKKYQVLTIVLDETRLQEAKANLARAEAAIIAAESKGYPETTNQQICGQCHYESYCFTQPFEAIVPSVEPAVWDTDPSGSQEDSVVELMGDDLLEYEFDDVPLTL
jgi:CRISPR/Cas system-associated exonuclease Cas4 (RecB family)